jgi:hypothetical protein
MVVSLCLLMSAVLDDQVIDQRSIKSAYLHAHGFVAKDG